MFSPMQLPFSDPYLIGSVIPHSGYAHVTPRTREVETRFALTLTSISLAGLLTLDFKAHACLPSLVMSSISAIPQTLHFSQGCVQSSPVQRLADMPPVIVYQSQHTIHNVLSICDLRAISCRRISAASLSRRTVCLAYLLCDNAGVYDTQRLRIHSQVVLESICRIFHML